MCSPEVRKEANRYNWLIKGQLIDRNESDATIEYLHDSYFRRLWNNTERAEYGANGFEAAYEQRVQELLTEEMENVAHLGYD